MSFLVSMFYSTELKIMMHHEIAKTAETYLKSIIWKLELSVFGIQCTWVHYTLFLNRLKCYIYIWRNQPGHCPGTKLCCSSVSTEGQLNPMSYLTHAVIIITSAIIIALSMQLQLHQCFFFSSKNTEGLSGGLFHDFSYGNQ